MKILINTIENFIVSLIGSKNQLRNTNTEFRGFLLSATPEKWHDGMPFLPAGQFKVIKL